VQAEEFGAWLLGRFDFVPAAGRDELLRFILDRANRQRELFLTGHFPPNDRFFGAASAPAHFEMRHVWRTARDVPPNPFIAVRIWRLDWDTEERARDDRALTRTLLAAYRPHD
jgi:hypothetical protein